jgi:hypothetical protein
MAIYASIDEQLGYDWGTPVRDAIVAAYGDTQRVLAIAGASFMPLMLVSIIVWKNLDVRKIEQTTGRVF